MSYSDYIAMFFFIHGVINIFCNYYTTCQTRMRFKNKRKEKKTEKKTNRFCHYSILISDQKRMMRVPYV